MTKSNHKELSKTMLKSYQNGCTTDIIAKQMNLTPVIVRRWLRYYADKHNLESIHQLRRLKKIE